MPHTTETRARAYEKIKARRKKYFDENGPCKNCGSWENLELDHINPEEKEHHAIWSWREERIIKELEKCQPLCRKCHMEKTIRQISKNIEHGTTTKYRYGCRCDSCRKVATEARRRCKK